MNNDLRPISTLPNFKRFCMTIGELPTSYLETMSYYEMLVWFTEYMKNTIIPTINNNGLAVQELQDKYIELKSYVDNYFDNLDVQEEINNKLDEMAESGQLTDIIAQYLGLAGVLSFNTVNDMKIATNLVNGSTAKTLGYHELNDGGSSLYKIRNITNDDIVNNMDIIPLNNQNLIAELIPDKELNLKCFGIQNNANIDNELTNAINYCNKKGLNIYIPSGKYEVSNEFTLSPGMIIKGCRTGNWFNDEDNITILVKTSNTNLFKMAYCSELCNLTIDSNNTSGTTIIMSARNYIHDIAIKNFDIAIQNNDNTSNLARFERITILNGNIGINLLNTNNLNTQSCSFIDIDIRECLYGLISHQPSNKFYNFCVQNGKTGGNAVILNNGANNNIFYGSYFENANYTNEVDLTTSKFNKFTGCRVLQYLTAFANNDGTNIIECNSIQNQNALINGGFSAFEKIGVLSGINNNQPSQYLTIEKDETFNNRVKVKNNNSSSDCLVQYENVRQELTNTKFQTGQHQKFNTPFFYKRTITPTSLTSGQSTSVDTSVINKPNIIGIANTNKPNVYAQIITRTEGGFRITLTNNSSVDYSGQDIEVYVFGCSYES